MSPRHRRRPPTADPAPQPRLPADGPAPRQPPPDVADETAADEPGPQRRVLQVHKNLKKRIDQYLHQRLKGISRSKVQQLIEAGGVTVNGRTPKASTMLRQGDVVDVILPPRAMRRIEPEPIPLDVIYEDEAFIVLNKQADLIVHPARGQLRGTLINGLAWHFKEQLAQGGGQWTDWTTRGFSHYDQQPHTQLARRPGAERVRPPEGAVPGLSSIGAADFRPGIVHRLDKNTTGVIVVAKNDQAHWQIARQFEDRSTLKAYLALVHGNLHEAAGAIDQPIGKHPTIREAYAVRHDSQGRHAVTLFRVREQYRGFALVELELKTGRTHQIRVHLSWLGHPVVGDIVYGGEAVGGSDLDVPPTPAISRRFVSFARTRDEGLRLEARARARPDLILATPALHAAFLRFVHPGSRAPMTFTAAVHEPMRRLIHELRRRAADAPVAREGWWVDLASALPQ